MKAEDMLKLVKTTKEKFGNIEIVPVCTEELEEEKEGVEIENWDAEKEEGLAFLWYEPVR